MGRVVDGIPERRGLRVWVSLSRGARLGVGIRAAVTERVPRAGWE